MKGILTAFRQRTIFPLALLFLIIPKKSFILVVRVKRNGSPRVWHEFRYWEGIRRPDFSRTKMEYTLASSLVHSARRFIFVKGGILVFGVYLMNKRGR